MPKTRRRKHGTRKNNLHNTQLPTPRHLPRTMQNPRRTTRSTPTTHRPNKNNRPQPKRTSTPCHRRRTTPRPIRQHLPRLPTPTPPRHRPHRPTHRRPHTRRLNRTTTHSAMPIMQLTPRGRRPPRKRDQGGGVPLDPQRAGPWVRATKTF